MYFYEFCIFFLSIFYIPNFYINMVTSWGIRGKGVGANHFQYKYYLLRLTNFLYHLCTILVRHRKSIDFTNSIHWFNRDNFLNLFPNIIFHTFRHSGTHSKKSYLIMLLMYFISYYYVLFIYLIQ